MINLLRNVIFFVVVCVASAIGTFGQERPISRDQYFAAYNEANAKTEASYPRQESIVTEFFDNGKKSRTEVSTYKYAAVDSVLHTVESIKDGKKTINTYIQLGSNYFCQEGARSFKRSRTPCEPVNLSMSPDPDTQSFSASKVTIAGQELMEYRMYTRRSYAPKANEKPKIFTFEQIFRVRPDGTYDGFHIENARETDPKEIYKVTTIDYKYDIPPPKIEAPIK